MAHQGDGTRGYGDKYDLLKELEALQKERDKLQMQLADREKEYFDMDDILDERQRELEFQEKKTARVERQLQACQAELQQHQGDASRIQTELAEAKKKATEKQRAEQKALKQLDDARNHIFRLQPRRTDITESEAQELFSDLFNSIHRWVTNRLETVLDELDENRLRSRPYAREPAKRFVDLVSRRGMQHMNASNNDEWIVISVIFQFLYREFFHPSFYIPLRGEDKQGNIIATIDRIESSMSHVPRDTDAPHCRDWRVEALTALTHEKGFTERREAYDRSKTEELLGIISPLVVKPSKDIQEIRTSIGRNIIRPALDLAHRLQLATTHFYFAWTSFNDDLRSGAVTSTDVNLSPYTCVDLLQGGKVVKAPTSSQSQVPGVTYLFDISPGLYSRIPEGEGFSNSSAVYASRIAVVAGRIGAVIPVPQGPTLLRWIEGESRREPIPVKNTGGEVQQQQQQQPKRKFGEKFKNTLRHGTS
ncbi:hypothetical protein BU24DRAFT_485218 [Aaosphaeria arxii CBS 175.79]|uniref:Uncharacterized protein n=1 Tax=Aaosphaeria arxii CBS 175.79 TaxID=1450172 RepID=A0A6A5XHX2_9PLEO|nr:uncharacterized protein BU24DRAFT_485218 [Aaosphaeria arxii CBS 175.79]KAF2011914.1 hypothetical protein BU24DRAFT_485218 [Aaosphaeria arxii CBS 175.79]